MRDVFSISGQHYLFAVQTFAQVILAQGGDTYHYELYDRTTEGVIEDVKSGVSDLGVIFETSRTKDALNKLLDDAGLEFRELAHSAPRVALPASHPLCGADELTLDDMAPYPYVYFYQGDNAADYLYEEAFGDIPRAKSIACTDRASLSELIVALNGYTVTSGILVGISDGSLLKTVPLACDVELVLGYIVRKGTSADDLSDLERDFVEKLTRNLERYAIA